MLLDQYTPGKWMPENTQSEPGFRNTARRDSLRSTCMLFDFNDSQVITRETECFSSGQGCHIADKTLPKKWSLNLNSSTYFQIVKHLSFDNCTESFRGVTQVKPPCQTDADTERLMALAPNPLLSSKHTSIPTASRPISMLGVKHVLKLLQDSSLGATNILRTWKRNTFFFSCS